VKECAVVGIPDQYWGERVCAALVLNTNQHVTPDELQEWSRDKIARYKMPKQVKILEDLPRNAMGKVTKPEIKKLFVDQQTG
jgi:malonyl-CoA/methylmalonyl-CoA synthetase